MVDLLPGGDKPAAAIDLCCGEGLLSEAILAQRPAYQVFGLDGSPAMLGRAAERLARFGERLDDLVRTNCAKSEQREKQRNNIL